MDAAPAQDFAGQLEDQLSFLEESARRFDEGAESEGKRLALALRILLYTRGRSVALLTHLEVRDSLPWTDSHAGPHRPGVITALDGGLCTVHLLPPPVRYEAPLAATATYNTQPPHCFADWWHDTVLNDERGNAFSRGDLILSVANQDGGAHVDARLNAAYADLTRSNSLQHTQGVGEDGDAYIGFAKGPGPVDGDPLAGSIALVHMRQITWEVLDTLERHLVRDTGIAPYVKTPICPAPWANQLKAGRNEPCPCGSGRKFKRCFGRRQARRVQMLPA